MYYEDDDICPSCNGTGDSRSGLSACLRCNGTGSVPGADEIDDREHAAELRMDADRDER